MWQIPAGWKWQKIEGGSPQRGTLLPKHWSWFGCVESHSSHWSSVWSLQRSAWNKTRKHIQIQICVRQAENNTRYTSLPHVWALWRLMIVQTRASKKHPQPHAKLELLYNSTACAQFILTRDATAIPPLFLLALVWIGQPWWIHSNHCSLSTEAHRCWLCKRLCHAGSHTGSGINMVSWFKGQAEQEINMTLEWSSIQIYWVDGDGVSAFVCVCVCVCVFACSPLQKRGVNGERQQQSHCPNSLPTFHLHAKLSEFTVLFLRN